MREILELHLDRCESAHEETVTRALLHIIINQEKIMTQQGDLQKAVADVKADVVALKAGAATAATTLTATQAQVNAILEKLNQGPTDDPVVAGAITDLQGVHADLGTVVGNLNNLNAGIAGEIPASPPPATSGVVIASISPASPSGAGGAQDVTITGTGFQAGATVSVKTEGTEVEAEVGDIAADGTTVEISVDFGGFVGDATVSVTNPDSTNSGDFAFTTS